MIRIAVKPKSADKYFKTMKVAEIVESSDYTKRLTSEAGR